MLNLYLFSPQELVVFTTTLCLGLLLQGYCVAYGFFRVRYQRQNFWCTLTDLILLVQLWVWLICCADTACSLGDGLLLPEGYENIRLLLVIMLTVLSAGRLAAEKRPEVLLVIPAAVVTLPQLEGLLDRAFPGVLVLSAGFWILRAIRCLGIYRRERQESLSAFSVKEAVDTMNFGILFYRGEGHSQGQILLSNRKMQDLMYRLTGRMIYSGKDFYERLKSGQVRTGCVRREQEKNLMYSLDDGSVWRFDLAYLPEGGQEYALLMASDITRYSWTVDQLSQQNAELEKRNRELKGMLQNMESLCRTEETLRAKSRVHDLLGQQISLILRSVREHREPEEAVLQSFREGLPKELKDTTADFTNSLQMAAESFKSLGVAVTLKGALPENGEIQKAFFEIAAEAMTNAVHHGYASGIYIESDQKDGQYRLRIWDNGRVTDLPILEGGGLRGMRRKVEELGGQFSYSTKTHFSILVTVPEGEVY